MVSCLLQKLCRLAIALCLVGGCLAAQKQTQQSEYQVEIKTAHVWVTFEDSDLLVPQGFYALPWKWDVHYPKQKYVAKLQLAFHLNESELTNAKIQSRGLGLFSLNMGNRYRYQINLTGWHEVGWNKETTQYRVMPRQHHLPADLLRLGVNFIDVELKMEPANDAGLSSVWVTGADESLLRYQKELQFRHNSIVLVSSFSFLIAVLAFAMWIVSKESFFVWAFLSDILFALRQLAGFVDYPPMPTWAWNAGLTILFGTFVGFTLKIGELLIPKQSPTVNKAIWVYLLLCPVVLLTGQWLGDFRFYRFWLGVMVVFTMISVGRVTWHALRNPDINLRLFTVAAWTAMVLGWYDFFIVQMTESGLGKIRLGSYTTILFNLGLAVIVIRRYLAVKQDLYQSQLHAELEKTKATMAERQRIMVDIHDTVGAHLVGVLDLIRTKASHDVLAVEAADALQDLRIAIDAIQPVNGSLMAVLATLRHRLEPRLELNHIQLLWQVEVLPRMESLSPQAVQHIQRLVIEAMSNVMAHAKATRVTFFAKSLVQDKTVTIQITDDGIGFDESLLTSAGQGLQTMRYRAAALGGTLTFSEVKPQGTCLTLNLPVT